MRELPRACAFYVIAVVILGVAAFARALPGIPRNGAALAAIGLFAALATLGDLKQLRLSYNAMYSVATAITFATAILFGPATAVCAGAISMAVGDIWQRKPAYKVAFNAGAMALSIAAGGTAMAAMRVTPTGTISPGDVPALVAYAAMNFLVNHTLVSLAIALSTRTNPLDVAVANYRGLIMPFIALYPLGVLLAVSYVYFGRWIGVAVLVIPTFAVYGALERSQEVRMHTRAALEALADTVDRRDHYTAEHSRRVAEYCDGIAATLGLSVADREILVSAARVHDLGKVSIPDSVLRKPGALDDQEWQLMRLHPSAGAEILERLPMYREGAKLVGSHHERLDGAGYPNRAKGNGVPSGARILAVADAYDAMTSDRPYRPAMAPSTAISRLREGAGTQFDAEIVEALAQACQLNEVSSANDPAQSHTPLEPAGA